MRKGLIYPLLSMAVAASLLAGCTGGQQSKDYMEENDSVTVYPPDTAFYGHLGEGTGMSSLELITDDGDTLDILKLTPDSLVLQSSRTSIPEKFHRIS